MFLFLNISCEKDLYQNTFSQYNDLKVSHISLNKLDSKNQRKINSKISQLKQSFKKLNNLSKFEYNEEIGVYVDTNNGTLVDNNGILYYTFSMYRDTEEKLENLILKPEGEDYEMFIAKYNIKPEEFNELSMDEKEELIP